MSLRQAHGETLFIEDVRVDAHIYVGARSMSERSSLTEPMGSKDRKTGERRVLFSVSKIIYKNEVTGRLSAMDAR